MRTSGAEVRAWRETPGLEPAGSVPAPLPERHILLSALFFLLLADDHRETSGFLGHEWEGLQADGQGRSPLCCRELLSVLILGFSKHEATRNSLVQERTKGSKWAGARKFQLLKKIEATSEW